MKRKILLCLGGFCLSAVAQRVEMVTTTASERWKNQKVKVMKARLTFMFIQIA